MIDLVDANRQQLSLLDTVDARAGRPARSGSSVDGNPGRAQRQDGKGHRAPGRATPKRRLAPALRAPHTEMDHQLGRIALCYHPLAHGAGSKVHVS